MIVKMTLAEMQIAYMVAAQRQVMNLKIGTRPRYGVDPEFDRAFGISVQGCLGEMAVAKGLNMYWSGSVGDFRAADVGGMVEVRSITHRNDCLILHDHDKDGLPFVLCYNEPGTLDFDLRGWLWGKQGKVDRFWRDPQGTKRHAYFVPQSELFDCEDLKGTIHGYS